MSKTLVLEYDDLTFLDPENCLLQIEELVRRHPDIKLSFFTVPMMRGAPLSHNMEWCNSIRQHIYNENVCLGVHGLMHSQEEFKHLSYTEAALRLRFAEAVFETADLPFERVFRGPHWGLNQESLNAISDAEYTHLYNHEDYRSLNAESMKVVYYNWNLKDNTPDGEEETIIAHGHTHNVCKNGIEETLDKVSKFIDDYRPEFKFINEV